MIEKINNTLIFLLSILLMCSIVVPVSADYSKDGWPLETRATGTVSGGVFTDSINWNGDTTLTLNSDVPNGVIRHAYLYTGIWGKSQTDTGSIEVTFNGDSSSNGLGTINLEGTSDSNDNVWCTGNGKYWIWYDVTDLVNPGTTNTAITSKISGSIDGRVYGILLVVVYEGGDNPKQIQYWINDGSDGFNYQTPHDVGTTDFIGAKNTDDITTAELTMLHLTGYDPICSDCLKFNNNILDTSCVDSNTFDVNTWDVTDYIKEPDNSAWYSRGTDAYVNVCNAILVIEEDADLESDLIVEDVLINPQDERSDEILRIYTNANNVISAVVLNNGLNDITDDFDVCFEADGVNIGCATVTGGLVAGTNTTIDLSWIPLCTDYPVSSVFPPQSLPLTITATVDSGNSLSKSIPAVQTYSTYDVIGGVVNNGYISKNFNCDTQQDPLDQFKYYSLTGGGVAYNVSGEKISTFATQDTDTRIHHIDLPANATVIDARLYVYWYDTWGNYKTYPSGCLADLNVNFEGMDLTPEAVYQDSKGFGYYQSPKGNTVFDVTSQVSGSADYTVIVKNMEPMGGNNTTLLGEMLVVIYEGADHAEKVKIWMLEGTDYLMAADDTHGSKNFSVSPEMATATLSFNGNINLSDVDSTRLIAVVAQGMEAGSDLLFNGDVIKPDAWHIDSEAYLDSKINVEDISVTSGLLASGNTMGFRDNGAGGMQACNAILLITGETIDWRDRWMGPDSDEGSAVTTSELQDAIHHWLDNILVHGHQLTMSDLQEVIDVWLSG